MNNRSTKGLLLFFIFSGNLFAFWFVNFQISLNDFHIVLSEPALAQRRGGRSEVIREVAEFVGREIISATVNYGLDLIFNPREETLSPLNQEEVLIHNRGSRYVGSAFLEPNNGYRYLASPVSGWRIYNFTLQQWEVTPPPSFPVYRTIDFYQDSEGQIFSVSAE